MQAGAPQGDGGAQRAGAAYQLLRGRRAAGALGEINVTPLVDVVLVLLLVFMVTAPMMSRGIDVSLPVATVSDQDPEDRLTLSVDAEGRTYIGDRPVNRALIEETLRGMLAGRATKVVYLRADERLRYGSVIEVVDLVKRAGVEQIGFVYVLPEEKARR
jgi:biopolymer transport protein ExbD